MPDDLHEVQVDVPDDPNGIGELRAQVETLTSERDALRKKTDHMAADRKQRNTYTRRLYVLVVCWLIAVYFTLSLSGCQSNKFTLDSSVLIALITTTTASVIGLFTIVANYLFPKE